MMLHQALGASLFNFERTSFVIYWEWGQKDLNPLAKRSKTEMNQGFFSTAGKPLSRLFLVF